ncbi:MAG: ABC transporter ATP-binding protein [bacterium]|nr:ABC transporter ATP-binding protein [bacterium]
MSRSLISVCHLSKTYRVYDRPWDRFREVLERRPRHRAFHALADVSFEVPRGQGLGIIGENGAGKSTLLKILSGVTAPTRGTMEVGGTVASLLELGMGFHPELTGRQNIRLTAAMMGLAEETVERKIAEIIDFSELGDFVERPVKTYSTGMAMRLGFSIAAQLEPEILIIDEALAVGDGYFQKKCMDRLLELVEGGCTLLFCSHALYYISSFCDRALWLRQGHVAALGAVHDVVREYENFLLSKRRPGEEPAAETAKPAAETAKPARIVTARLAEHREEAGYHFQDPWILEVEWETRTPELAFHVGVGIDRIDGVQVCSFSTHRDGLAPVTGEEHYRARLLIPELPILKGEYALYVYLLDESGLHVYDQEVIQRAFRVEAPDYEFGLIATGHRWDLECMQARTSTDRRERT